MFVYIHWSNSGYEFIMGGSFKIHFWAIFYMDFNKVLINCEITIEFVFILPQKNTTLKKNKTTPCVYLALRGLCPFHGTWITFGLPSGNQMWPVGTSPNGGLDETSSN